MTQLADCGPQRGCHLCTGAMGEATAGPSSSEGGPYLEVLRKRRESWHTFPAGLRVLVVDGDATSLKVVERMLKKCSYQGVQVTLSVAVPLMHALAPFLLRTFEGSCSSVLSRAVHLVCSCHALQLRENSTGRHTKKARGL